MQPAHDVSKAASAVEAIKAASFVAVALGSVKAIRLATFIGTVNDVLEHPRPARRALATIPGQSLRSRGTAQILSRRSKDEQGALQRRRLAGAALLVPQGGAQARVLVNHQNYIKKNPPQAHLNVLHSL